MHVLAIDVGVIWNLGPWESVLVFNQENRRAVALVKKKTHNAFIMIKFMGQPRAPISLTSHAHPGRRNVQHGRHATVLDT